MYVKHLVAVVFFATIGLATAGERKIRGLKHYESQQYGGGGSYHGGHGGHSIEVEKPVQEPIYKEEQYHLDQYVPEAVAVPIHVKVPQPITIEVPVPFTIEKKVEVPIEKRVPFTVEKPYPVEVVEKVPYPVPKPYPVPVPIYRTKHIYHKATYSGGGNYHHQ